MATLRQLIQGTQKLSPQTIQRAPDGKNSPFTVFEVQKFKGVNSLVISSQQKMSGRWPKGTRPTSKKGFYKQTVRFSLGKKADGRDVSKLKPKASKDRALVSCGCDSYYYMWWWGNKKVKAHEGSPYKAYKRKTTDRPELNPQGIPGMCKHLIYVTQELKRKRLIQ